MAKTSAIDALRAVLETAQAALKGCIDDAQTEREGLVDALKDAREAMLTAVKSMTEASAAIKAPIAADEVDTEVIDDALWDLAAGEHADIALDTAIARMTLQSATTGCPSTALRRLRPGGHWRVRG